jgi:hypothetical protein
MKENDKTTSQPILPELKEYIETQVKLLKYEAIDKGSAFIADIIADIVQVVFILFAVIFASLTLAFFLSDVLNSLWMGFGAVLLLYILALLMIRIFKKGFEKPIINAIVRKFFKH